MSIPCLRHTPNVSCAPSQWHMQGYRPRGKGPFPAYLMIDGAGPWRNAIRNMPFNDALPEMQIAAQMARLGYISAISEFPMVHSYSMQCEHTDNETFALLDHARLVFGWTGAGDTSSIGPLSVLCRQPNADCSRGIALHGHSVGGLLANLAPRVAVGVTSLLLWGAGSRSPYGRSCCGLISGDMSCCHEGDGVFGREGVLEPPGGLELTCQEYNDTGSYLDRSRRRMIIALNDTQYGDCYNVICDGDCGPGPYAHCTESSGWDTAGARILGRRDSGYDCGNATTCIMEDGSGYYLPDATEITADALDNSHNFHVVPSASRSGYTLNPAWLNATAAWGFVPSTTWLAQTGLQPLA